MRRPTILIQTVALLIAMTLSVEVLAQNVSPGPAISQSRARVFIPFALHAPVRGADGKIAWGVDGYGKKVDGNMQPIFDTLIAIANPTPNNVNVRFTFYDSFGKPQLWGDGRTYRDYLLDSQCSLATTLIPRNVFPDPPQSFVGYGILELTNLSGSDAPNLPVYAMIGGGGFYPAHWNTFSATVPVYKSTVPESRQWFFPYLIPYFEDLNHSGSGAYRTGMVITNFGEDPVTLRLAYHVGDVYPRAQDVVRFEKTLSPRESICFDLYTELRKAGYPEAMNSEGWLLVETDLKVPVSPYLLHTNRDYNQFSVGQSASIPEGR